MRIAISCFAFLVAAVCYFLAAVAGGFVILKYFEGELSEALNQADLDWVIIAGSISFYSIIGTIALCLGLHLLAKPRQK